MHPKAGRAMRPHFPQLLPPMALFALRSQSSALGTDFDYAEYRQVNVEQLTHETLELMERVGGPGTGAVIKRAVPTYQPAEEELHRGFRQ